MKYSFVALVGLFSLVAAQDEKDHYLRVGGSSDSESNIDIDSESNIHSRISKFLDLGESNCHAMTSQSACNAATDNDTKASCVWCKCSAVPSVCVSPEESKSLPPGVFECDADDADIRQEEEGLVFDFGRQDGSILQLREKINEKGSAEGEFCDASSKSISGYMDLKGSKVGYVISYLLDLLAVNSTQRNETKRNGDSEHAKNF